MYKIGNSKVSDNKLINKFIKMRQRLHWDIRCLGNRKFLHLFISSVSHLLRHIRSAFRNYGYIY